MSSSKIMGYNLDDSVLDGVAREDSVQTVITKLDEMGSSSGGFTAIKSLQHIVSTLESQKTSSTIALNHTVTPENCFVLMERLYISPNYPTPKMIYTLNESSISLEHANTSNDIYTLGFWVIEFC